MPELTMFWEMEFNEFMEAVGRMRHYQKAYFRDRKQSNLIEAKRYEQIVDRGLKGGVISPPPVRTAALEQHPDNAEPGMQIRLFNEEH